MDEGCIRDGFPSSLCNTTFSEPQHLKTDCDQIIHIGVTLKIINNNNKDGEGFSQGFKKDIETFLTQMLQLYTEDILHLILITDSKSVKHLNDIIRNIISKHLTNNIIATYPGLHIAGEMKSRFIEVFSREAIKEGRSQGDY